MAYLLACGAWLGNLLVYKCQEDGSGVEKVLALQKWLSLLLLLVRHRLASVCPSAASLSNNKIIIMMSCVTCLVLMLVLPLSSGSSPSVPPSGVCGVRAGVLQLCALESQRRQEHGAVADWNR